MTRKTLAAFQPFADVPEMSALIREMQARRSIGGLTLKYLQRKYLENEAIQCPDDLNLWFEAVLQDPEAVVAERPRQDSRYVVHSARQGKVAVIATDGQRVSVYQHNGIGIIPWLKISELTKAIP